MGFRVVVWVCLGLILVSGHMYDVIEAHKVAPDECANGCAPWSEFKASMWAAGSVPADAGSNCAQPANMVNEIPLGSWCFCAGSKNSSFGYCTSAEGVPEQVNLQIAGPDSIVISFVTFEATAPAKPPQASISRKSNNKRSYRADMVTGITHVHTTAAGDRTYYMHFIHLKDLESRASYVYSVKSGGDKAVESDEYEFRAPYADGETRINLFGDMGVYYWNNMGNLQKDCANGDADLVIQIGDHAYNQGQDDERRGDGYMSAYQQILSQCPWMPIVGNHEYYDGAELSRYLDQTWEKWGPINAKEKPQRRKEAKDTSTATSALGFMLSAGNHHAAGIHGSLPSNTSRYFSVDFGLVHLVALDLNVYYGVDPCGDKCRLAQMEWLKADLAQANTNRDKVPWVVGMAHYPFYCTGCDGGQAGEAISAAYYASDDAEIFGNNNATAAMTCALEHVDELRDLMTNPNATEGVFPPWNITLKQRSKKSIEDLVPIIDAGGMDAFISGHWHFYESLWPGENGKTGAGGAVTEKSFVNPNVTIHITTGNGGPPGNDSFAGAIPMSRFQSLSQGYGRLTVHNESHMTFTQFWNIDGSKIDEFTIVSDKHGPFH